MEINRFFKREELLIWTKKDAQDNVYMGNAFMNLRKTEVSKVAPNRAALIGKFSQSMNSGNMSAMKEVEEADKKWLCMLFGIPYEANIREQGQARQFMYTMKLAKKF